jgi:hypothetical protein
VSDSPTTHVQRLFEETRPIRYVRDPAASPCLRSVTRIWHFPSGDVLLERAQRRDCLLPTVDRVAVPASDSRRVAKALVLETDTTVEVVETADERVVTEFDRKIML